MLFFSILPSVPVEFFSGFTILPNIFSIIMYYYFVEKAEVPQYFMIFIFGIIFDTFNGMPIGYMSLTWLISVGLSDFIINKLYSVNIFSIYIRNYAIFDFINMIFSWTLISILYSVKYPFSRFLWQFIINIVFLPITIKVLLKFGNFKK
jgi:hypothetical protein